MAIGPLEQPCKHERLVCVTCGSRLNNIQSAVEAEREEIAHLVEQWPTTVVKVCDIAAAIRAREEATPGP